MELSSKVDEIKRLTEIAKRLVTRINENNFTKDAISRDDSPILQSLEDIRISFAKVVVGFKENSFFLEKAAGSLTKTANGMLSNSKEINKQSEQILLHANAADKNMQEVSLAAQELDSEMLFLSANAQESSQKVSEVTFAVEQLAITIKEISVKAAQAHKIVSDATENVQEATLTMREMGQAAANIGEVAQSISSISDQTKLLALNATIESNRAQSAGIRFSVVASEIKSLAAKTSLATKEITERIDAMQKVALEAVEEIEQIKNIMLEVNTITDVITSAVRSQSFSTGEMAKHAGQISSGIAEMARSVKEAALAVTEVANHITTAALGVRQIDKEIAVFNRETEKLSKDSIFLYACAMEADSRGNDLNGLLNAMELSPEFDFDKNKQPELFRFTEDIKVHITELDQEHKTIISYINRIHEAVKKKSKTDEIAGILSDLANYTIKHFRHEEKLFAVMNYENSKVHIQAHNKLLAQIAEIVKNLENKQEINFIAILLFLKKWLINHILGSDKQYSEPMQEFGIITGNEY